ncbi:MAG: hypothetical protein HOW73_25020 [Polyangiaceae bacterium]|nr:hypothetical protein [Polyangiaceae bacterium]
MASIDAVAKRYYPAIVCGLLATVAYFQSSGISSLIAEQLPKTSAAAGTEGDPEAALEALKKGPKASAPQKSASEILKRNPFDSVTGPLGLKPVATTPPPTATKPVATKGEPPKCSSGEVTLIAGSLDPAYSFAVITSNNLSKMRRIGDDVDGKKVESIHGESVVLASDGGDRCKLTMHDEVPGAAGGAPTTAMGPTKMAPDMESSAKTPTARVGAMAGIRKVSDTEYVLEGDSEQKLTQMKQAFMKSAKVVDGQGLRLYRAAQTTILGHLGLKKGDIVKTMNGYDMSSLDQSTEAYEKLNGAKSVQVVIEREGKPLTMDYKVE